MTDHQDTVGIYLGKPAAHNQVCVVTIVREKQVQIHACEDGGEHACLHGDLQHRGVNTCMEGTPTTNLDHARKCRESGAAEIRLPLANHVEHCSCDDDDVGRGRCCEPGLSRAKLSTRHLSTRLKGQTAGGLRR